MYKVKLERFEGPLDLLLRLIEEEKMDISQISLAKIAEQYIEHLKNLPALSPDEMADFLVIASKLLWIKSKTLLPYLRGGDEEEEASNLEQELKIYREYYEASKIIQGIISKRKFCFARAKTLNLKKVFSPPPRTDVQHLFNAFTQIIEGLKPLYEIPKKTLKRAVSIQEKIRHIQDLIRRELEIGFSKLIKNFKNRREVVVSFLALLELTKQEIVMVEQGEVFDEIVIRSKTNHRSIAMDNTE